MWPFRRNRAESAPEPEVAADPGPAAWETLPPLSTSVGSPESTFKIGAAVKEDLVALQSPRLSHGLGHMVSSEGPAGVVSGLVSSQPSGSSGTSGAAVQRRAVQRRVDVGAGGASDGGAPAAGRGASGANGATDLPLAPNAIAGGDQGGGDGEGHAAASAAGPVLRSLVADQSFAAPARPVEARAPDHGRRDLPVVSRQADGSDGAGRSPRSPNGEPGGTGDSGSVPTTGTATAGPVVQREPSAEPPPSTDAGPRSSTELDPGAHEASETSLDLAPGHGPLAGLLPSSDSTSGPTPVVQRATTASGDGGGRGDTTAVPPAPVVQRRRAGDGSTSTGPPPSAGDMGIRQRPRSDRAGAGHPTIQRSADPPETGETSAPAPSEAASDDVATPFDGTGAVGAAPPADGTGADESGSAGDTTASAAVGIGEITVPGLPGTGSGATDAASTVQRLDDPSELPSVGDGFTAVRRTSQDGASTGPPPAAPALDLAPPVRPRNVPGAGSSGAALGLAVQRSLSPTRPSPVSAPGGRSPSPTLSSAPAPTPGAALRPVTVQRFGLGSLRDRAGGLVEQGRNTVGSAYDTASNAATSTYDTAAGTAGQAGDMATSVYDSATASASSVSDTATGGASSLYGGAGADLATAGRGVESAVGSGEAASPSAENSDAIDDQMPLPPGAFDRTSGGGDAGYPSEAGVPVAPLTTLAASAPSAPALPTEITFPQPADAAASAPTAGPSTAAEGPAAAGGAAGAGGAAAGGADLDELARKLYDRIRWRLRAELRLDMERSGLGAGIRR